MKQVRVLFVCLGNICRSPMAEAVFMDEVRKAGLADQISADSAGTGDYHIGDQPHHGTRGLLRERGIAYTHAARQVRSADFDDFDYLIVMDRSNLRDVQALGRKTHAHVGLFMDFADGAQGREVPDPYFTGNFEEVYDMVLSASQGLISSIRRELAESNQPR